NSRFARVKAQRTEGDIVMSTKLLSTVMATALLAAGFAGLATAHAPDADALPTTAQGTDRHFDEMDANKAGRLTLDEIHSATRLPMEFERHDANNTGVITRDEFRNYVREAKDKQR